MDKGELHPKETNDAEQSLTDSTRSRSEPLQPTSLTSPAPPNMNTSSDNTQPISSMSRPTHPKESDRLPSTAALYSAGGPEKRERTDEGHYNFASQTNSNSATVLFHPGQYPSTVNRSVRLPQTQNRAPAAPTYSMNGPPLLPSPQHRQPHTSAQANFWARQHRVAAIIAKEEYEHYRRYASQPIRKTFESPADIIHYTLNSQVTYVSPEPHELEQFEGCDCILWEEFGLPARYLPNGHHEECPRQHQGG